MAQINVFTVHSAEDKKHKDVLLSHLSSQKEDGKASFWDRDSIMPGNEEASEVKKALEKADIVLLLLSADFFGSEYCKAVERKAFALAKSKKVTVVPIMLRHFDLGLKYDSKATIPDRKTPIFGRYWNSEDEAFHTVAEIIGDIIDDQIAGQTSPHLKPPSLQRRLVRKLKRPAGILLYIFFLAFGFSLLFLPKRNLPVEIKLEVNQVNFRLVKKEGNGLWSKPIFAKMAKIKNFSTASIPGKKIRLLDRPDELSEIPDSGIIINRLSTSLEPYLYLSDIYLSRWNISDSSDIELRMAPGKSLFIAVDNGRSEGVFNFSDSLELSTEYSILQYGNTRFEDDLEAVVFSSLGRVNFLSDQFGHSISLDSLEESIDVTHLYVTGLRFEKDMRDESGTLVSSILSGVITTNGYDPISIDRPEIDFLKFESKNPMKIQKINVSDNSIELLIHGEKMHDIQKGTSLANMKSEMPTLLDWLAVEYRLEFVASIFIFLAVFIFLLRNLLTKSVSR